MRTYVNEGSITAIGIIFPVLGVIALAIRAYGWRYKTGKLEIDDILIIPAACMTVATGAAMVIGAQMSIIGGHSIPFITPTEHEHLGKFEYAYWIAHVLTIGLIKLSILFLFRRVFKGRAYTTLFDYANWALIIAVTLWTVVFLFFEIFACGDNPSLSWASLMSLRNACIDTFAMQTGCAVFNWVMDLAILVEPLFMIGSLNMNLRRKLQTSLVFLLSLFAVVAGLLRMIIWIQIVIQDITRPRTTILGTTLPTTDQEGVVSIILFWTYVEIGVGFLVACLPPCAALVDKMLLSPLVIRLRSFTSSSKTSKSGNSSQQEGKWKDMQQYQQGQSWTSTADLRASSTYRQDGDIELNLTRDRA